MKRSSPYGTGPVRLVSTEWLAGHMNDKKLVILDVQPNIHDYILEHIPGAIYLNEGLFRTYEGALPTVWVRPEIAKSAFGNAGIGRSTPVVVYTAVGGFKKWGDGLEQTMVAYTLARYGVKEVYLLDGGLDQWKKEGRLISQDYPTVQKKRFRPSIRKDFYVTYDEFLKLKDRNDVIVLDARPAAIYEGKGPWKVPGHIPGAVNLPWASLMDDNNKALLKPEKEVADILKRHGVTPDKTVVCTCGTGREATNEFILFAGYLGYKKVKLFEGSFTEWVQIPGNATITGKDPRKETAVPAKAPRLPARGRPEKKPRALKAKAS
jgi:thiosulfate/3-mercaptopyruvate sulfurtransferase